MLLFSQAWGLDLPRHHAGPGSVDADAELADDIVADGIQELDDDVDADPWDLDEEGAKDNDEMEVRGAKGASRVD